MNLKKLIIILVSLLIVIIFWFILNSNKSPYEKYGIKNYQYDKVIIKVKDRTITVAPLNYDGDAKDEFKDKLFDLKLANKVSYYRFTINSTIKNDKKTSKYEYKKLKEKDVFNEINDNSIYAYIWLKNDKVTKLVLYGETIIQK